MYAQNIYQTAREQHGLTQETAAELMHISSDSIRAYENNRRRPSDDIVASMVQVYENKYLGYQHLMSSPLNSILPQVELCSIQQSSMKLLRLLRHFAKDERVEQLLEIAEDGVIDDFEMPVYLDIMDELSDIVQTVLSLDFGAKKSPNCIKSKQLDDKEKCDNL